MDGPRIIANILSRCYGSSNVVSTNNKIQRAKIDFENLWEKYMDMNRLVDTIPRADLNARLFADPLHLTTERDLVVNAKAVSPRRLLHAKEI